MSFIKVIKKYALYIAFIQAWVATLGSLYFSEIKHLEPCVLCWYQRILMFPIAIILAVAIIRKDKKSVLSFLWRLRWSFRFSILVVRIAICTSGDPVSHLWVENFSIKDFLSFLSIVFLNIKKIKLIQKIHQIKCKDYIKKI